MEIYITQTDNNETKKIATMHTLPNEQLAGLLEALWAVPQTKKREWFKKTSQKTQEEIAERLKTDSSDNDPKIKYTRPIKWINDRRLCATIKGNYDPAQNKIVWDTLVIDKAGYLKHRTENENQNLLETTIYDFIEKFHLADLNARSDAKAKADAHAEKIKVEPAQTPIAESLQMPVLTRQETHDHTLGKTEPEVTLDNVHMLDSDLDSDFERDPNDINPLRGISSPEPSNSTSPVRPISRAVNESAEIESPTHAFSPALSRIPARTPSENSLQSSPQSSGHTTPVNEIPAQSNTSAKLGFLSYIPALLKNPLLRAILTGAAITLTLHFTRLGAGLDKFSKLVYGALTGLLQFLVAKLFNHLANKPTNQAITTVVCEPISSDIEEQIQGSVQDMPELEPSNGVFFMHGNNATMPASSNDEDEPRLSATPSI